MELLVVIGIIAILAAVAFPAFSLALVKARTSACSGNLRAIGVGLLSFAGDNDGNFPEAGGTIPYNTIDATTGKYSWTQQLEPYMGGTDTRVYQCPDSSRSLAMDAKYGYFLGGHAAYAQTGAFGAVRLSKMHAASDHILAGDAAFGSFDPNDADKDDYTQDPGFNGNAGTSPLHGGTVNILFADGHIQNVKTFDKTQMTTVYQGPGYDYSYDDPP